MTGKELERANKIKEQILEIDVQLKNICFFGKKDCEKKILIKWSEFHTVDMGNDIIEVKTLLEVYKERLNNKKIELKEEFDKI